MALITAEVKKSLIKDLKIYYNSLKDIRYIFTSMITFVTWSPPSYKGGQVAKVNHTCENML